VGNRALGDRPSQTLTGGRLAASAALVLTSPFTPMLFMGEEWGATTPFQYFTDHAEPELAEAIRVGRTTEFAGHGWAELYGGPVDVPDPQSPSTVAASRLDWSEPARGEHARLLAWYRTLIRLRRTVPALADGDLAATSVGVGDDGSWVLVRRGDVSVAASIAPGPVTVPVGPATVLAAWDPVERNPDGWRLPGAGALVLLHTEPEDTDG
jgi:maltooligosyltrehalose trehalohydrolase